MFLLYRRREAVYGPLEEAIVLLESIRALRPDEAGILALLAQAHLDLGRSQVSDGFQIRAEQSFIDAIEIALDMIQRVPGFRTMAWKAIGDAAFQLAGFSTFVNESGVREALQAVNFIPPQDTAAQIASIVPPPSLDDAEPLSGQQAAVVSIHAYLCQVSLSQASTSGALYDLAVALQAWTTKVLPTVDTTAAKEKSIELLKKALQLDVGNAMYWGALGNAYFLSHPKAAQHSYIRAIEIDSKSAGAWVNLGLLYAYHGDVDLANEALYRAQVLDPDNTLAWVGQYLIATANGDKADATLLLEHAVGLPTPVVSIKSSMIKTIINMNLKVRGRLRILIARIRQDEDAATPRAGSGRAATRLLPAQPVLPAPAERRVGPAPPRPRLRAPRAPPARRHARRMRDSATRDGVRGDGGPDRRDAVRHRERDARAPAPRAGRARGSGGVVRGVARAACG